MKASPIDNFVYFVQSCADVDLISLNAVGIEGLAQTTLEELTSGFP